MKYGEKFEKLVNHSFLGNTVLSTNKNKNLNEEIKK